VTPQFKNRLVGVIILVALVVIFLPSIIDGEKTSYQQEFVSTPIKPALKAHSNQFDAVTELEEKQKEIIVEQVNVEAQNNKNQPEVSEWKVEEVAELVQVDEIPLKDEQTIVNTSKETAVVDKKKIDPAWTIQLGAFQNKKNINTLLKKLNKAGFQVHTIPREVMDGQLTRVFVGPDVSKKSLEEKLPRLKRLTNLNGKIVPFNPVEP